MPTVKWSVRCDETQWGHSVAVTGSFNTWNKTDAIILSTSPHQYPVWTVSRNVAPGRHEYKYVIVGEDGSLIRWEADSRDNRIMIVDSDSSASTETDDTFGKIPRQAQYGDGNDTNNTTTLQNKFLSHPGGQHSHNGNSQRDISHLDSIQRALVDTTNKHQSWRLRLQFVRSLFTDSKYAGAARSLDGLVSVSIYLTLLSTGQVRCGEDGGHHRPNHHAHEARLIDLELSGIVYNPNSAKYAAHVIRRIMPHLPSYSNQFTVSVPLTRIRDIAHRGDIPKDLKLQIKHTLQNKLHRSAGPEDLYTSAAILERISHGGYSEQFVEQFRIFHDELKAFFNMSSLDERLQYLSQTHHLARAGQMLKLKTSNGSSFDQLKCIVELRDEIARLPFMQSAKLNATQLKESAVEHDTLPSEDVQKTRLADIDLESYSFVVLAALAKEMEQPHLRETPRSFPFAYAASILGSAMQVIAQCEIEPLECRAISSELHACAIAIGSASSSTDDHVLRLRAAVDRAARFARSFSDAIVSVYTRQASPLALALGVDDERAIAVLPEAEVRATVTFQTSRISAALSSACRKRLALPAWDVLHAGSVIASEIRYVNSLGSFQTQTDNKNKTYVVVCGEAQGDEDIPPNVIGIVNGRPLPHLSHLGVRARQAGVVFVSADESAAFNSVWSNRIQKGPVKFVVTVANGLATLEQTTTVSTNGHTSSKNSDDVSKSNKKLEQSLANTQFSFDRDFCDALDIRKATKPRVSSKAYVAGLLGRIADDNDGLFQSVHGIALPHGLFHAQRESNLKAYNALVYEFHSCVGADADKVADELRAFIMKKFTVNQEIIGAIQKGLIDHGAKVMVRSSANVEDLEKLSGAGLYDTVAAVLLSDAKALQHAIQCVWASIWTRRAASSRRTYQVDDENVSMAVLIQPMVSADLSFVAFSHEPVVAKGTDIYIEMAVGMGETLASAVADGSPYRFKVDRELLSVDDIALASYNQALIPNDGNIKAKGESVEGLRSEIVDYSSQRLTFDRKWRHSLIKRIAKTIIVLEKALKGPQDVEGCVSFEKHDISKSNDDEFKLFVVQARPQIINT